MIYFKCSNCGEGMEAPVSIVGDNLSCPNCGSDVTVPNRIAGHDRAARFPKWALAVIAACFVFAGGIMAWIIHARNKDMDITRSSVEKMEPKAISEARPDAQEKTESRIVPEEYIFGPLEALDADGRNVVLLSAMSKTKSVVRERFTNEYGRTMAEGWVVLNTEPMTATEVEVLGDSLLEKAQKRFGKVLEGIKIQVYWNSEIAQTCVDLGYNAESQVYNSFWERGKRVRGAKPRSLDEEGLYESLCNDCLVFSCQYRGYHIESQVLYIEASVECMTELIFLTFCALHDGFRCCAFDRLPDLEAVRIIYKDVDGNDIGGAMVDSRYWAEMIQIQSVPTEVRDELYKEWEELSSRYKSKLITEAEYEGQLEIYEEKASNVKANYYQQKWLELFPLVKEFRLDRELPLIAEDFRL